MSFYKFCLRPNQKRCVETQHRFLKPSLSWSYWLKVDEICFFGCHSGSSRYPEKWPPQSQY